MTVTLVVLRPTFQERAIASKSSGSWDKTFGPFFVDKCYLTVSDWTVLSIMAKKYIVTATPGAVPSEGYDAGGGVYLYELEESILAELQEKYPTAFAVVGKKEYDLVAYKCVKDEVVSQLDVVSLCRDHRGECYG
jgi:hypothetical protein